MNLFGQQPRASIIAFAINAHQSTNHYYDGNPYVLHLQHVVYFAMKYSECVVPDAMRDILESCWLHDVIEDCRITYSDVRKIAGQNVADIVYAVTNEKGKNRFERANEKYYEEIKKITWAKYVKLCDRLANVSYSNETRSQKLNMYKQDHEKFVSSLFYDPAYYKEPLEELRKLTFDHLPYETRFKNHPLIKTS